MRKYAILRKAARNDGAQVRGVGLGHASSPLVSFERLSDREAGSIAAEPEVETVAPVMPTRLIKPLAGNEAPTGEAWGIDAVGALASEYSGAAVTVVVLDTGIDASHPAFAGVELIERDFSGDGNGDRQGHGTHCAGTIFGRDVDGLRIGVARGVSRALIGKVLSDSGGGDSQMIFDGLQWALAERANVISMSLGFDFPGMVAGLVGQNWPAELATSVALEAYRGNLRMFDAIMAMTRAYSGMGSGTLVIAASGNESRRDDHPDWRIAASLPAAAEGVISVAAVGQRSAGLGVAPFSNSMATLSAPGVDIVSARAGGGLVALSGTSMACPHVAGVAALWWEAIRRGGKAPTALNVQSKLIANAQLNRLGSGSEVVDVGQGLVSAP